MKKALLESKRESEQREKALRKQEKELAIINRIRTQAIQEHAKDIESATRSQKPEKVCDLVLHRHGSQLTFIQDQEAPSATSVLQLIKVVLWREVRPSRNV